MNNISAWKRRREELKLEQSLKLLNLEKDSSISESTKQKSNILKNIFQKKYSNGKYAQKMMNYRKAREKNPNRTKSFYQRMIGSRLSFNDFHVIKVIGKGAFGEVLLVRKKDSDEVLAMKKLRKKEMIRKKQTIHVRAERDILVASDNPWIIHLQYSFQDEKNLYIVMEYCPGGDLMTWLINKEIFTEDETRFYIAELILAVDFIHTKMKYVHRDLKPDNILLDDGGHVKLTDFGLCKPFKDREANPYYSNQYKRVKKNNNPLKDKFVTIKSGKGKQKYWKSCRGKREMLYSTVGSPGYIAPEVLTKKGYRFECDWWSVGIIMFEMIFGFPPFYADDPIKTCQKIVRFKDFLEFPKDCDVSQEAIDFIKLLLCESNKRIGVLFTVDEIKKHPFFKSINFDTIRESEAPIKPEISSSVDTSYFDKFEPYRGTLKKRTSKKKSNPKALVSEQKFKSDQGYLFHNFTYRADQDLEKLKEYKKELYNNN